jgi:hypothetical protein
VKGQGSPSKQQGRFIRGKGSKDDGKTTDTLTGETYTKAEFGITAEEGRNVHSVKYDINTVSKLEGFKIICEFLSNTLRKIPKCSKEEAQPLDGLMVYSQIKPSSDILFK